MAARAERVRRVVDGVRPLDGALPLLIAVVGTVEIASAQEQGWPVGVACLLASCVALSLARVIPLVVPVVVGVLYLLAALGGYDVSVPAAWLAPPLLAAFLVGLHAPREQVVAGLGSVLALLALTYGTLALATDFDPNVIFGLVGSLGPWALGTGLQRARSRAVLAAAALEHERLEGVIAVGKAAARERARIADELHDVLAHTIGEMVVQAAVADDELARDPERAARTLAGVARTGRAALRETGRLLRLLRDEADELGLGTGDTTAAAGGADGATTEHAGSGRRVLGLGIADLALPLAFAVAGMGEIALDPSLTPRWLWIAACLGASVALVGRRARPASTAIIVATLLGLPMALGSADDDPASWILALGVACFAAGGRARPARRGVGAVTVAWAIVFVLGELGSSPSVDDALLSAAFAFVPAAAGAAQARSLARARADGVAQEQERTRAAGRADVEAAAERRRIARELHDLLASSISVMIVQASLAEELCRSDPAAARTATASVEEAGRRALEDIGVLLRLAGAVGDEPGIEPRRGIADIAVLADELERAGVIVEIDLPTQERALPAGVELASYRIVQEALTNVLKHAPGSGAAVRLACDGPVVAIEVVNGPATAAPRGVESGHGLVGLRERVAHHGGDLSAGPTPDGGFRLSATLRTTLEGA